MNNTDTPCNICNNTIPELDPLFHFSGYVNGTFSLHIYVCSECTVNYDLRLININTGQMKLKSVQ